MRHYALWRFLVVVGGVVIPLTVTAFLPAVSLASTETADESVTIEQLRAEQARQAEIIERQQALIEQLRRAVAELKAGAAPAQEAAVEQPESEAEPSVEELLLPEIPKMSEGVQSATTVGALAFNPDISVVGDFVANVGDRVPQLSFGRHDTLNRHVELALSQRVSHQAKAVVKLAYGTHQEAHEHEHEHEHQAVEGLARLAHADEHEEASPWHSELELEEAYLQFDQLWPRLQVRIGRERVPIMLFNQLDGHELPFVNRPLAISRLLGDHGLIEDGGRLSWMLPTRQYMNLDLGVYNSRNDVAFDGGHSGKRLWMARLNGYHDWSEGANELTWSLGAVRGPNDEEGHQTDLYAVDLHFQHLRDQFDRAFVDAGYLRAKVNAHDESFSRSGYFIHAAKRWDRYRLNQLGALWERAEGLSHEGPDPITMLSMYYTWHLTERVLMRLQWSHANFAERPSANMVFFQTSFVMGTHPPHD